MTHSNSSKAKYILTKYETIRRTEKVEYEVEVPDRIKNKMVYADKQVLENNYKDCKVVDIPDSEMLDEENINLKKAESGAKLDGK